MKKVTARRVLRFGLATFALLLLAFGAYVFYLDRIVTPQFEGRRWTLPAKVYAQPLELYAGMPLNADELAAELDRLHYVRVDDVQRPGTYRRRGSRIELAARKVRFADEAREAQLLTIAADARGVSALSDARGRAVPVFRLDPLLIGSIFPIHGEDRIVVPPERVPRLLTEALVVLEDRKFYSHRGIDPEAIVRAAWANLRAGGIEQGGSTLTQQLVKSYFLDDRQTYGRKFKEALMAMILETRFEKDDLLNAYVNEIYLGQDGERAIHGFGLASRFYYGKPLEELELHEMALLVALVRGPSYYDPRTHADRAMARRNLVLDLLARFEIVTDEATLAAKAKPLGLALESETGYYPAYLDFVRRTLRRDYRDSDLTEAGLSIYTTLDPRVQAEAQEALTRELERLGKRSKDKSVQLEGAVVVTEPQSGAVLAIVGGRRGSFSGFNRALDGDRPIGSLVKPVVYLAALQSGRFNAASLVADEPVEVKLPNRKFWRPENFSKTYAGPVPLVRALAESLNAATVNLGLEVGLPRVIETFEQLGVPEPPARNPSLLLGSYELSPMEVAQLYNAFANGGFRTPLRAVRTVLDAEGKPLKSFALQLTPAADSATIHQLNRMLVHAIDHGTGRAARAALPPEMIVAGKTGTSSDYRDSWFAGFSGTHLAVVWVGYDDNRPTGLTGSAGALAIWAQLMQRLPTRSWEEPTPEALEDVTIEFATGLSARADCGGEDLVLVAVPEGTQLPVHAGCGTNPLEDLAERAREWWREMTR
ncbi:MAG TPA: penicillin-binding protein 1B [Steroidobacteraceae bacterium]|nr:penicillin-binding protein 1B [Steroidobacteraceae bacterium]